MVKMGDNKIAVYKGEYKPVDLQKNAKSLGVFSIVGTNENDAVFDGTYNDYLTFYGKTEQLKSPNLCPNLKPKSGAISPYSWQITPNSDGTFNFLGAMVTGETVGRVTLPAGRYTASGCEYLNLYWDGLDGFLSLPGTFTLEKETTILLVFWYTETVEMSLENQYIQIEAGDTATEFLPYSGGLSTLQSPYNFRFLTSSSAKVKTYGKNVFNFTNGLVKPGEVIEKLPLGVIAEGVMTDEKQANAYSNGWYNFSGRTNSYIQLKAGDTVTISMDYTVLEAADGRTGKEAIGIYLYSATGATSLTRTVALSKDVGKTNRPQMTYSIVEDGTYYPIVTLNSNKVKIENIQIEYGDSATEYYPYFGISELEVTELRGIEVEENHPGINYTETIDGITRHYISDCFKANRCVQKIGKVMFTGNEENWVKSECAKNPEICIFSISKDDANIVKNALCSHFNYADNVFDTANSGDFSNNINSQNNFEFAVPKSLASTVSGWQNWLMEQNSAQTPLTVYYVLNEPKNTARYILDGMSYKPVFVKTFGRRTYFEQTPNKNCLGYGNQKLIKIKQ